MSLIIIEGVDGSGKTTLVNDLSTLMPRNTVTMHRGPLRRPWRDEYVGDLASYTPRVDNILSDRWHVGERIYGPVLRGAAAMSEAQELYVDLFLHARGALVAYMDTPLDTVLARLDLRGEDLVKVEDIKGIHAAYRDKMRMDPWAVRIPPTWTQGDLQVLMAKARKLETTASRILAGTPSYVGPSDPDALVVVESAISKDAIAFLESAVKYGYRTFGMVSCADTISRLRNRLDKAPRQIVALTSLAGERLAEQGFPKRSYTTLEKSEMSIDTLVQCLHHAERWVTGV